MNKSIKIKFKNMLVATMVVTTGFSLTGCKTNKEDMICQIDMTDILDDKNNLLYLDDDIKSLNSRYKTNKDSNLSIIEEVGKVEEALKLSEELEKLGLEEKIPDTKKLELLEKIEKESSLDIEQIKNNIKAYQASPNSIDLLQTEIYEDSLRVNKFLSEQVAPILYEFLKLEATCIIFQASGMEVTSENTVDFKKGIYFHKGSYAAYIKSEDSRTIDDFYFSDSSDVGRMFELQEKLQNEETHSIKYDKNRNNIATTLLSLMKENMFQKYSLDSNDKLHGLNQSYVKKRFVNMHEK